MKRGLCPHCDLKRETNLFRVEYEKDGERQKGRACGLCVQEPQFKIIGEEHSEKRADPLALAAATKIINNATSLQKLLEDGVPPIEYLVDPYLPRSGCLMIAAPPKNGKTFLALDLARAVATGTPWLGKFETQQGLVLLIDEESGTVTLHDRLKHLWRGSGHDIGEGGRIVLVIKQGVRLDTLEGAGALGLLVEEYQPTLIIIDSVVRVMSGDENSSSDVRRLYEAFTSLMEGDRVSIVLLHHERKGSGRGNKSEAVRGSGDFSAMVDALLTVRKTQGGFKASLTLHRHLDTNQIDDFDLLFRETGEGGLLLSHAGVTAKARSAPEMALDALLEWGRKNRLVNSWERKTARDAVKACGHSKNAFDQAMILAEEDRLIVNVGFGRWQFVPGSFPLEEEVSEE